MARPKAPCGTESAYRRHLRNGEPVDEACRVAHTSLRRVQRGADEVAPDPVAVPPVADSSPPASRTPVMSDDMRLILDTLREAFQKVAEEEPSKLAPIARVFREAVQAAEGPVVAEPRKELSLVEQLAAARASRAARTAGAGTSA